MQDIRIVLAYPDAGEYHKVWAGMEEQLDFRHDLAAADQCTLAFAATELQDYLQRTLPAAKITIASEKLAGACNISLSVQAEGSLADGYSLEKTATGLEIRGQGRTGALYGAYHLLKLQGWRWYSPGLVGEIAAPVRQELALPEGKRTYQPDLDQGRGFDFEGYLKDSADIWLWMAKNRLNVSTDRHYTSALQNKLGMKFKTGGHIFEKILDPARILASGKTMWEEHADWYGLPPDGQRSQETALNTQFCVSNPDLQEFLGREFVQLLAGAWQNARRIDVWGFDTWGQTCSCAGCQKIGNNSDQAVFLLTVLRDHVNRAVAQGHLDHQVELIMCAYGGTATIEPPSRPIPPQLLAAGDLVVFYPITRCYAHDYFDPICPDNKYFAQNLTGWCQLEPKLPVIIGEYYNVSKFEDLPLVFTRRISRDLPDFYKVGIRAITYMHLPIFNWGMRTLNHVLYAELAWDTSSDSKALVQEYFQNWYGGFAQQLEEAYGLVEKAWAHCGSWRSWADSSVLSQLMMWDGQKPQAELKLDLHFGSQEQLVRQGRESVQLLDQALEIVQACLWQEKNQARSKPGQLKKALNPTDLVKLEKNVGIEFRLAEDQRQLLYGRDTMALMTELVAYHRALGQNRPGSDIFRRVEDLAARMESYYMPLGFEFPKPVMFCKDGLARTQLRDVISRCRAYRNEKQD